MINYEDEKNIKKLIKLENDSLSSSLDIQESLYTQLLKFMKNFIGDININEYFDQDDEFQENVTNCINQISKSNNNIAIIKDLIKDINNFSNDNLNDEIQEYNKKFNKNMNMVYGNTKSIQKFIHQISTIDFSKYIIENKKNNKSKKYDNSIVTADEIDNMFLENTLIVSDTQKKVILPYKITKVVEILRNNKKKYSSMQDVIDKLYTIPIKYYKFTSIARFKEAYNLVTKKENRSKISGIKLGLELMPNYNLHPAIISACNSVDELDMYLACLHDNILDDFHIFNIKYEIAPILANYKK